MNKKAIEIRDLGPGDGGKGGVVHKAALEVAAHTILKVGGSQGSHGVRTSQGESFNFSQWGCGTFEGVRTHITDRMTVHPIGIINEGDSLKYKHGVSDAFDMLTIDENALVVTQYHGIASHLAELARKDSPRGTVGTGAGTAMQDSQLHPELALYARDLARRDVRDRLAAIRKQKIDDLAFTIAHVDQLLPEDREKAQEEIGWLNDDAYLDWIVSEFHKVAERVRITDKGYLQEVLAQDGNVVIETSHGILTDRFQGFHPHTTRLRTLPSVVTELLDECGYDGERSTLGIFRAYNIRHGAGPMVSHDPSMSCRLLPGSSKEDNRWQGKARVGPIDLVALRYAIDVCGGGQAFKGLAVTWFDQVTALGKWDVCTSYSGATDPEFFSPTGEILVHRGEGDGQLVRQGRLTEKLFACKPNVVSYDVPEGMSQKDCIRLCKEVLEPRLDVPVRMISFGPTEKDKICL